MTEGQHDAREEALTEWRAQADANSRLDRRFSGERLKRVVSGERLTKAAFVVGTGVVLFFVFNHDSKEQRLLDREARAAMELQEPSIRDFRPPVMPARIAASVDAPDKVPPPPKPEESVAPPAPVDPEILARRRKAEQLQEARTKSDIVVRAAGSAAAGAADGNQPITPAAVSAPAGPIRTVARGQGSDVANDPNTVFGRQVSGHAVATSLPIKRADLHCAALQGKMIDAELETAINTDLPGQIRAIVSSPLYAEQGRQPLLTSGSRLIGVYNSAIRKGQVRVFAIWNRAIRPDGVEISLDSHATDSLGRSGMTGETDNHFPQIFGASVLLSIIGAGTSTVNVSSESRYNSADEYRRQVQQSFVRTADRLLEPYGSIPPTNSMPPGARIKVFLNRDLDFCSLNIAAAERRQLVFP
jgi:type IV secretion system protein VirB10